MKRLAYSKEKGTALIDLLDHQDKFEVLEKLVQRETFAAYVLRESGWTWGHFYRAAFCCVVPEGDDSIVFSITHLNIQKAWHGVNLFKSADMKIEEHIYDYVLNHLSGGRNA